MKLKNVAVFCCVVLAGISLTFSQPRTIEVDTAKAVQNDLNKSDTKGLLHFGKIVIATTPDSSEIVLDSTVRGYSSLTLDSVSPGAHVLIIKRKGYFGKKVTVDVQADSTISLNVTLTIPAGLVVSSSPLQADIIIDGKKMGVTPWENLKLKPGEHDLRIEKDGCIPFVNKVTLTDNKIDTFSIILKPSIVRQDVTQITPAYPKTFFDKKTTLVVSGIILLFAIVIGGIELSEAGK